MIYFNLFFRLYTELHKEPDSKNANKGKHTSIIKGFINLALDMTIKFMRYAKNGDSKNVSANLKSFVPSGNPPIK